MKLFTRYPLRITVPLFLLVIAVVISGYSMLYSKRVSDAEMEKAGMLIVKQDMSELQDSVERSLLTGDTAAIEELIAHRGSNPNIDLVLLVDENNVVLHATSLKLRGLPVQQAVADIDADVISQVRATKSGKAFLSKSRGYIFAYYPVELKARQHELRPSMVGILFMKYDLTSLKTVNRYTIERQTWWSMSFYGLLFLLLGVFLYYVLTKRVMRLVAAAKSFAEGDASARFGLRGNDEIAMIGEAFDDMADKIAKEKAERRQSEQEVAAAAGEWQITFDAIPASIFLLDLDGRMARCNKATELLLGKTQDEIIGLPCWGLMHGTDKPIPECPIPCMKKVLKRTSLVMPNKDRWLQITVDPILDAAGELTGTVHTIDDITDRKKAEDALNKSEAHLNRAQEIAKLGSWIYDLSGRISWSDESYRIFGVSPETFTPEVESFINLIHPEDRPAMQEWIRACSEGEGPGELEFRALHPDGSVHWISGRGELMRAADGRPDYMTGTAHDITAYRKIEEQLRHAQKMEAVGTLAGGIAHDFNNILNVIMGYGGMVYDSLDVGSASKEQMDEVLTAAERAANLTKRLLVFSRKQVVEVKPVNINELILGLQKMLVRIIRENIDFKLDLADRPLMLLADAGQIEQVLMNLASNAKDAMLEGGRLTIGTGLQELDDEYVTAYGYGKPGRYALITVADTGQGMDEETKKKIFEPFFTTKGIGEGTGLGLAISYGIIKQHSGYIKVYSELGKGTEFKIYLPLIEDSTAMEKKTETPASVKGGNETILLAEDDASLRKLSRIVLESYGYTVITAEDGEDAITKFMDNREKISLALIDMIMPKKNGKAVSEAIQKVSPATKILFASGYTMDIMMTKELTESGFDFLLKPVSPKDLLKKVREVLDR